MHKSVENTIGNYKSQIENYMRLFSVRRWFTGYQCESDMSPFINGGSLEITPSFPFIFFLSKSLDRGWE